MMIVLYLILVYCSYHGSILNYKGKIDICSLYVSFYKTVNKSCHIFTETYKTKLLTLQKILKNVKIKAKDYSEVLQDCKKGDFVFLDPPYIEEEKEYGFSYNKHDLFDIVKLKKNLKILDSRGVKWMMTQVDTLQVRSLFKGYNFYTYINTNSMGLTKSSKQEVIITNYTQ